MGEKVFPKLPDVHDDEGALGDEVASIGVILRRAMRNTLLDPLACGGGEKEKEKKPTYRGNHMPSHDLFGESINVRQQLAIRKRRQPIAAHHTVDFLLGFTLHIGEKGHGKEKRVVGSDGLHKGEEK
jgi:hypothetical protein